MDPLAVPNKPSNSMPTPYNDSAHNQFTGIISVRNPTFSKPKDGKTLPKLYQAMITGSLEHYNGHLLNMCCNYLLNVFSTGLDHINLNSNKELLNYPTPSQADT